MTKAQILRTVRSLPKDEQLDLALELWESIDTGSVVLPLTASQKRKLDRRVAADETNPLPAEEWSSLKKKLLKGDV